MRGIRTLRCPLKICVRGWLSGFAASRHLSNVMENTSRVTRCLLICSTSPATATNDEFISDGRVSSPRREHARAHCIVYSGICLSFLHAAYGEVSKRGRRSEKLERRSLWNHKQEPLLMHSHILLFFFCPVRRGEACLSTGHKAP